MALYAVDHADAHLYAYAADGTRLEAHEFGLRRSDAGGFMWGLWSDAETLLTSHDQYGRVLAYRLSDGARLPERDIDTRSAGQRYPRDLWSDGETLWVADAAMRTLVAYAVPGLRGVQGTGLLPVRVPSRASAVPSADPGEPVSIPDAGLRGRIAAALGKGAQAPIGTRELAALVSLDARDAGVADLTGLEHAVNLEGLDLGGNPLADLRALASLPKLAVLNLDGMMGADVWQLAGLGGLVRLSLRACGLDDLTALAGLGRLRALDVAGGSVSDVGPLAGLAALEALDLSDNRVEDIWPLAGLERLVETRLGGDPGLGESGDRAR